MPTTMVSDVNEASTTIGALPLAERRIDGLACSTAGFVGFAPGGPLHRAVRVDSFPAFAAAFCDPGRPQAGPFMADGHLAHAVRGFFCNGGRACWVARAAGAPGSAAVAGHTAENAGLDLLADLDEPTVIAAPDAHCLGSAEATAIIQRELVATCERVVGRIALVDLPPGLDPEAAIDWRAHSHLDTPAAATYYPWVEVPDPTSGATTATPPCGHVAGLWARVDTDAGPYQAPTAEVLLATDGPLSGLTGAQQHRLNRAGVNCLRAWPGPELRAWGACTLSTDADLRYLHRQRIVGHLAASIAEGTRWAGDEDNDERLREQLRATVTSFLAASWRAGALQGHTPAQAFFVRCDGELNDDAARARGDVVLEIGLAVRRCGDFRVLRISHRALAA